MKNKLNREKVQYQQCTGSQSYIAKAYLLVRKSSLVTELHGCQISYCLLLPINSLLTSLFTHEVVP